MFNTPLIANIIDIIFVILESDISGKTLTLVDRQCLKDIGLGSIGKQLTILSCIKELLCK